MKTFFVKNSQFICAALYIPTGIIENETLRDRKRHEKPKIMRHNKNESIREPTTDNNMADAKKIGICAKTDKAVFKHTICIKGTHVRLYAWYLVYVPVYALTWIMCVFVGF